jgi:transposase
MQSTPTLRRCKKGAEETALTAEEMRAKQDIGISRGGKNTKIHVLVDGLGNPIRLIFTSGEVHDSKQGVPLLEGYDLKAYGTIKILTYIRENGGTVVTPPKSNTLDPWDRDFYRYKERHLVECFFNKIRHYRRVATRYDKFSTMFQAFVFLACIMIWLK